MIPRESLKKPADRDSHEPHRDRIVPGSEPAPDAANDAETAVELERGLASYFDFYCYERLPMALGYQTPWEVYSASRHVHRVL